MRNKITLLLASLLVSLGGFAQWTKPAAPASTEMAVGQESYLYNKDAGAFLVGANDWGTRASVSDTLGHKVYIENGSADGSYYITNYVLQGGMKNQIGYMFTEGLDQIWVDNTKDGKTCNQYEFYSNADGTFQIGLSAANTGEWNKADYGDVRLGVVPEKNDTRLYFCTAENDGSYDYANCKVNWYFVSPSAYATYVVAEKQYNAAVALGAVITEAESLSGVDATVLSAAKAAYANTSSTPETLNAQAVALEVAVKNAKYAQATVSNPVEVLAIQGIARDFNDSDYSGWESTTGASNKGSWNGNNAADFAATGNHYENWNWDAFSIGKVSAKATNIPSGVYHLSALAFTTTVGGTFLYAGGSSKEVQTTKIYADQPMDIYTVVNGGSLEIGLDVRTKGTNWIGLDNVYLYYLGNSEEAYETLIKETLSGEPDYENDLESGAKYCQTSVYETYKSAKSALQSAKTADDATTALAAFNVAANAMTESVNAYGAYASKTEEAMNWLDGNTSESEQASLLSDYLMDDTAAEGSYNGNGGAQYILKNGLLDNAKITAETTYLDKIFKDAEANAMSDGDDCTSLLVNPNFTETGGWTSAAGTEWPKGSESFRVFEAHNRVCDVYQNLSGLQKGIYEMNCEAVYKPVDDTDASVRQTYAYINDFETLIPVPAEDVTISSAEDASANFAEGKYPVTVYGLVTDGTMKIGIARRLRPYEGGDLWAGGVKLTFRAKNAEACEALLSSLKAQAQTTIAGYIGTTESSNLQSAIDAAEGVSGEDGYNALVELKTSLDAANTSATLYANLNTALANLKDAIDNNTTAGKVTVDAAQKVYDTALAAYNDKSYDNAAAEQAVSDVNAASVSIKIGGGNASEDYPQDYTDAIVNNTFDPTRGDKSTKVIEGWSVEGALNGYKEYSCSFNKGTFDLHQELSGLPKGNYKVTVNTYYRAGSFDEEATAINAGTDTHLMKFYANSAVDNYETSIMNLSEGSTGVTLPEGISTSTINGITVPNGTSASVACYKENLFLNELQFSVGEDGKATIGLKLQQLIGTNDYTVVGPWHLYYLGADSEEISEQNVTSIIVNNTFEPTRGDKSTKVIEGWSVDGALNGYKEYSCSFNKGTFDLHQDLSGLPEGTYRVTVHTYYRAGSFDEEAIAINAGTDTHLMKLYANTTDNSYEKSVMNLSEGSKDVTLPEGISTSTINGITVPNGTSASVACYNAGLFLNELVFYVGKDGKATIGLKLDKLIGTNDYTVVGEWDLYYYGTGNQVEKVTPVEAVEAASESTPVAFYSLSGAKLSAPQKGVNIVKMSNGRSVKVVVR